MNREKLERLAHAQKTLLDRQKDDPLLKWAPTNKQKPFIDSVLEGKCLVNGFIAANRSGKSDAGGFCGANLARFGDPNTRFVGAQGSPIQVKDRATSGWVVSVDFPSSRDQVQPKYFDNGFVPPGQTHEPFIPKREIKEWRVSDQILLLKNGSIVGFKSADSGRSKFQGAEKDWVHFDEEPPKSIYEETVIRVGGRPLRTFFTCTLLPPEGTAGGVSWMFPEIIQPFMSGERKDVMLFGASIYDNPHIPKAQIVQLEAIYPEGSNQRRIRLGGEWLPGLSGARAYAAFDRTLHVRSLRDGNGKMLIDPYRPLCWFWDFNVEPMVSGIGQRDGRLFKIFHEIVMDEGSIPDMVEAFRYDVPSHRGEIWLYGDATGSRRQHYTQENESSWTLILNLMRNYGAPVRKKVPEANPFVADRINAMNRALKGEDGAVSVEIDLTCKELIADLEQVLMDQRGKVKKVSNRNDPYFRRTHISDACTYWIFKEEPVRPIRLMERIKAKIGSPGYSFG